MKRTASAVWKGDWEKGKGALTTQSGKLNETPYSYLTRFDHGSPGTNPEELIAAAHAGCFTMALAAALGEAGFPPEKLATRANVTMEQVEGNWTITAIDLELDAQVPNIDRLKFAELASTAKANCPVSRVLKANVNLDARVSEN